MKEASILLVFLQQTQQTSTELSRNSNNLNRINKSETTLSENFKIVNLKFFSLKNIYFGEVYLHDLNFYVKNREFFLLIHL